MTFTTEDMVQAFLEKLPAKDRLKVERILREFVRLPKAEQEWVIQALQIMLKPKE